ncbi:MAG: hypothetical protein ACKOTB_14940, partial [Planctomycetia bacterium]
MVFPRRPPRHLGRVCRRRGAKPDTNAAWIELLEKRHALAGEPLLGAFGHAVGSGESVQPSPVALVPKV